MKTIKIPGMQSMSLQISVKLLCHMKSLSQEPDAYPVSPHHLSPEPLTSTYCECYPGTVSSHIIVLLLGLNARNVLLF